MAERWLSLADHFTPTSAVRDGDLQRKLREQAPPHRGEVELLRCIAEGRLPGEEWRHQALCRDPELRPLFFPKPADPDEVAHTEFPEKVEFGRLDRLERAVATCNRCPVQGQCLAWGIRIAGSDKDSIIGALTWSQRKQILAELRKRALGSNDLLDEVGWKEYRLIARDVRAVVRSITRGDLREDQQWSIIVRAVKGIVVGRRGGEERVPEYARRAA